MLLLHGGGWRMGNKSMMDLFGPELARLGFLAVAPEYRLLGEALLAGPARRCQVRHPLDKDECGLP